MAERLAELGIDPTPLFATASGILRLYADTLNAPTTGNVQVGLAAQAELLVALDRPAGRGDTELAVDRQALNRPDGPLCSETRRVA